MMETFYLLESSKNAKRLQRSIKHVRLRLRLGARLAGNSKFSRMMPASIRDLFFGGRAFLCEVKQLMNSGRNQKSKPTVV
jgi:hypothetical protein